MLYQYIWRHGLLGNRLETTDRRRVDVIRPGLHNRDAGPDFSGARLRIDGREWAGNVEVHVKASDWYRHGHDHDPAYSNVILHLVAVSDTAVADGRGSTLPQVEAKLPESLTALYSRLSSKISDMQCHGMLAGVHPLIVADWLSSLSVERMQAKARRIRECRDALGGDWEHACLAALARALGFGLNADPMEMTARSVPLRVLAHHSDSLFQTEALLFGQAGMLDGAVGIYDDYYQALCREYAFLSRKYNLRPMRRDIWKYSKTRPQNFPGRRLAILARATLGGFALLSKITRPECRAEEARQLFSWTPGDYWTSHFDFGTESATPLGPLSNAQRDLLIINFMAPMLYAYGASRADLDMTERALALWDGLAPENNRHTRACRAEALPCRCAAESQALIQLNREYCDRNRCLECRLGHALMRSSALNGEFSQ